MAHGMGHEFKQQPGGSEPRYHDQLGLQNSQIPIFNVTKSFHGWITSGVFIVQEHLMCAFGPYIGDIKISYQVHPTDMSWVSCTSIYEKNYEKNTQKCIFSQ